LNLWS